MTPKKPIFSEERIKEIVQNLRSRVAEHIRLQKAGILPFYSRIPVVVMESRHVMAVLQRERKTAYLVMKDIREKLGKKPRQKISVSEFCQETGIPYHDVQTALDLLT
jgi:hypothetical protein